MAEADEDVPSRAFFQWSLKSPPVTVSLIGPTSIDTDNIFSMLSIVRVCLSVSSGGTKVPSRMACAFSVLPRRPVDPTIEPDRSEVPSVDQKRADTPSIMLVATLSFYFFNYSLSISRNLYSTSVTAGDLGFPVMALILCQSPRTCCIRSSLWMAFSASASRSSGSWSRH